VSWVIFRFVLVGPIVGCVVYSFVGHLGPALTEHAAGLSHLRLVGSTLLEGVVAGAYGVIFTYPLTGSLGATAGLTYWLLLRRRRLGNWRPSVRMLIGGFIGLLCASAFDALLFNCHDIRVSVLDLISWAIAGAAGGASSALTVGTSLYEVVLNRKAN
jgi:hypothetical protein